MTGMLGGNPQEDMFAKLESMREIITEVNTQFKDAVSRRCEFAGGRGTGSVRTRASARRSGGATVIAAKDDCRGMRLWSKICGDLVKCRRTRGRTEYSIDYLCRSIPLEPMGGARRQR